MSNNILVKDNFFDSIDELRELALSFKYMYRKEIPWNVGWRGCRTGELSVFNNPVLEACSSKVLETVSDFFNLTEQRAQTFFHITFEDDMKNQLNRWHRDPFTKYAGVLYLTPNPPSESGTTIFEKGKQVDVENKYNRLIAYDGTQKHGATNFFGDNRSNGRMTFTFFIDRKRLIEKQREKENAQYEFYDDFESKF